MLLKHIVDYLPPRLDGHVYLGAASKAMAAANNLPNMALLRTAGSTPVMPHIQWSQNATCQVPKNNNPLIPQNGPCYSHGNIISGIPFGGVPVIFLLNFGGALLLLLLFCIIRKSWDHGRRAMVADNERVMEVEQANGNTPSGSTEAEQGFFSWICFTMKLTDKHIEAKCGPDAVYYLSFERSLILVGLIMTTFSMAFILPLNWIGFVHDADAWNFGRITIGNLPTGSVLLWVHVLFAMIFLIVTFDVMQYRTLHVKDRSKETTRNTLLIRSVPKTATEEEIKAHFTEAYPTCEVTAVTLGLDVTNLSNLVEERIEGENLCFYKDVLEITGKLRKINPCVCGQLRCCRKSEEVGAIEFCGNKEQDLLQKMREQLEKEPPRPLGMAFVTFKTNAMAKSVRKDFHALKCNKSIFCCGRRPKSSSRSEGLKVKKWRAEFASLSRSINWKNLPVKGFKWMGRFVLVNLALLAGVTFLTTPAMMANTFHMFNGTAPITDLMSPIVRQFVPSLLLLKLSALLPAIVHCSTDFESQWSRSSEQLSTMRKLYFSLIFMVLILPSLGLTSLPGLFQWLFQRLFHGVGTLRLECLFMPDQGAFAVNYVITAAFMGSVMDLLQFSQLLRCIIRWVYPRSAPVGKYVKQNQANELEYGPMYGWTLCTFTVVMANSLICPIIVPFGLLWMLLKYFVNKYNLYFVYRPNPIDIRIHMEAIDMVMAAAITCLLWLYFTFLFTAGFWSPIAMSTMVLALITFLACIAHNFFGCLKYKKYTVTEEAAEKDSEVYLPRVLHPEGPAHAMMQETIRSSLMATDSRVVIIHDIFPDAENALTIRTSPVAECMSTDSVVVMMQETCEAADNGPVAEGRVLHGSSFANPQPQNSLSPAHLPAVLRTSSITTTLPECRPALRMFCSSSQSVHQTAPQPDSPGFPHWKQSGTLAPFPSLKGARLLPSAGADADYTILACRSSPRNKLVKVIY
ncbi:CSC1-like protein 1 [Hippoglossus hippoglossus]|uniref:CSC1-like protein 1 n=1 Tax=Hippoglossus hippoglossus TaxID=8267 RepID=UPI00148BAA06|nr:CSC1-like protein 1 [Hippoglossus hippoglossus]